MTEKSTQSKATSKDSKPEIELAPNDAPVVSQVDPAELERLQGELAEAKRELDEARQELAAAQRPPAEPVTAELETKTPAWVCEVSGMAAKDIAGWTVVNDDVLIVMDTEGRAGHRFSFLPHQRH
jgi:hypothetical protein